MTDRRKVGSSAASGIVATLVVLVTLLMIGSSSANAGHSSASASSGAVPLGGGTTSKVVIQFVAQGCPKKSSWDVTLINTAGAHLSKTGKGKGAAPSSPLSFVVPSGIYSFNVSNPPGFNLTPLPPNNNFTVNATGKLTKVDLICQPLVSTIPLLGTPIIIPGAKEVLNATTARPWGETFDPLNGCLYVTEDPIAPGLGYVTAIGPSPTINPTSYPAGAAPGSGWNPLGIAWAPAFAGSAVNYPGYPGGFLLVADSGSNGLSLFGIAGGAANPACQPTLLGTGTNYFYAPTTTNVTGLTHPFDVVFGPQKGGAATKLKIAPGVWYVTWIGNATGFTAAFAGLVEGRVLPCTIPLGLSYAGPNGLASDPNGYLEISNFAANGWVTTYKISPTDLAPAHTTVAGAVVNSPKIFDRDLWTTVAPKLQTAPNGTKTVPKVVAISDSNYGISGNVEGTDGATALGDAGACNLTYGAGTPLGGVMGELSFPKEAPCLNSVSLTNQPIPALAPLDFGNTWAYATEDVYEVVPYGGHNPLSTSPGVLEAVTYTQVACGAVCPAPGSGGPTVGYDPIEVIWTSNAADTVGVDVFASGSAFTGTLVVTNYDSGTLSLMPGFYLG